MPSVNGKYLSDSEILSRLLELMELSEPSSRPRLLHTLQTFYGIAPVSAAPQKLDVNFEQPSSSRTSAGVLQPTFSEDRSISPKEFLFEKKPQTDIEKVTCLAFYLAHYMSIENFKTLDISKLNTDAAQIKFSNAAQAVDNAVRAGLLINGSKGHKRISALGELYVTALPDRAAAREAIAHGKPKRRGKAAQGK